MRWLLGGHPKGSRPFTRPATLKDESDAQLGRISHSMTNVMLRSQNEEEVGQGIKESGVPREEIFLTSKLCVAMLRFVMAPSTRAEPFLFYQLEHIPRPCRRMP